MCGLFLSVGLEPDRSALMRAAHRGPDGIGWRVFDTPAGPLAMGHLRLSIIDPLPRSEQPMADEEGRLWLTLNGEIYNYRELQTELAAEGVRFRTCSDSEVALEAWRRWGPAAVDRFLGMFALFVWDDRDKVLHVARDRFGIKPLFFTETPRGVAFGSEIKQLIELPGVSRRLNARRTHNFLEAGMTDHTAETLFEAVRQLRPGERLRLDLNDWRAGGAIAPVTWWAPSIEDNSALGEAAAADRFRELFLDSVKLHLRSDVRLGSCLSGGLDSSAIVGAMTVLLDGAAVDTFSAAYAEKEANEQRFMADANAFNSARAHYLTPGPDTLWDTIDRLVYHQDEPFGSTSIFAQWSVFEAAAAEGVRVMLDGQGADEQLAGYHGGYVYHLRALIRARRWVELSRTVMERRLQTGVKIGAQFDPFLQSRVPLPVRRLFAPNALHGRDWLSGELAVASAPEEGSSLAQALVADRLPSIDNIGDLCRVMIRTNLPMLLRYEDRNSMAHSIEARVPFLDHRLVNFTLGLGDAHKMVRGETKRVLRLALGRFLPATIRNRRDKLGFATPEAVWFRGPLRKRIEAAVEDTLTLYPDFFNPAETRRLRDEILDGVRPFDFVLWRIVNLGMWGARFNVKV